MSIAGYVASGVGTGVNTATLDILVSNPQNASLSYSISPRTSSSGQGVATISSTGQVTYTLQVPTNVTLDSLPVVVIASNAAGSASVKIDVAVQILPDPYVLVGAASQPMTVLATGAGTMTTQSLQLAVTDSQNRPLTYAITTASTKGISSITNSGLLTYSISTLTNANSDSLSILVSNGSRNKSIDVPIAITTDPLAIRASNQSLNINATTASGTLTKTLQVLAKDPSNGTLTYAITLAPSRGSASVNASGLLTYSINTPTTATSDSLQVTISNGSKSRVISVLLGIDNVANADPLIDWQWHLINKDKYFSSTNPPINQGCDLNIAPSAVRSCAGVVGVAGNNVWSDGYMGNNVNVTVVDTGMEIAHEDLAANVVSGGSYNFLTLTNNPTSTSSTGDHGTSVAGLIAGVANNGIGVSGIAPKAKLRGNNLLSSSQSAAQTSIAFGGNTSYGAFQTDVFNFSAGTTTAYLYSPSSTTAAIYTNAANNLRSGKGAVVVKSAGNGFAGMYDSYGTVIGSIANCVTSNVTCQSANNDEDNTVYSNLIVAAVNADGTKTTYSNAGSPIWISGFGGQNNYDLAITGPGSGTGYFPHRFKPAMLTTDQTGCLFGYVRSAVSNKNALDKGDGTGQSNANCAYYNGFNGTSAAAPTVAGVVALMLQANPNLTWRDVRHILAKTARKISPAQAAVTNTTYFSSSFVLEQSWVTNAAGFNFHNYFGFGLIDARRAVDEAKAYVLGSLGTFKAETATSALFPNTVTLSNDVNGLTKTFVMSTLSKVEQAELQFFPEFGYLPYCTQIELTSPSGTKSILLNMDSGHTGVSTLSTSSGTRFLSNAFYGENAAGTWTLRVINSCITTQSLSGVYPQKLTLRGR